VLAGSDLLSEHSGVYAGSDAWGMKIPKYLILTRQVIGQAVPFVELKQRDLQ